MSRRAWRIRYGWNRRRGASGASSTRCAPAPGGRRASPCPPRRPPPPPPLSAAASLADYVEQRLALLDIDRVQRAREGRREFGRVVDALAIASRGGADLLEGGEVCERDKRRTIAARRFALWVHADTPGAHVCPQ